MTMTWKNGRQLATLQDVDNTISYEYDSDSIRTSKTVDGVKHTYAYLGGKLMYETRGDAKFYYSYDANGVLYSVKYTLTDDSDMLTYFFTHNSRGDIVGIYDSNGTQQAKYEYDAWGNILSVTDSQGNAITDQNHIANLNPFRYRGYYYDSETGLYYLMSRYYDPVTHRFINADGYFQSGSDILDTNMSTYCRNNPVVNADPTGKITWYQMQQNLVNDIDCDYDIRDVSAAQKAGFGPHDEITMFYVSGNDVFDIIGSNTIDSANSYFEEELFKYSNYFAKEFSESLSKASKILLIHQISYETAKNLTSGNSIDKIAYDIMADGLCTLGPVAVSTIVGTSIGGPVGTGVGFIVGAVISIAVDGISYNGKTGREHLKSQYP